MVLRICPLRVSACELWGNDSKWQSVDDFIFCFFLCFSFRLAGCKLGIIHLARLKLSIMILWLLIASPTMPVVTL